jgi:hypothetical protein
MGKSRVTGVNKEIAMFINNVSKKRLAYLKAADKAAADWLRQSQKRAPIKEGIMVATGKFQTKDLGVGHGISLAVSFDTPYAMRMHEGHYQAHDPHDKGVDKTRQTIRIRKKGVTVTQEVQKRTVRGMWRDSQGNLHGRKYITRAWDENVKKYEADIQKVVK